MDEHTRRIIHVDMDAFYAQIEQRDFPEEYAGEPIAVGGTPPREVVQTASYEARPYGVHSAQLAVEAEQKCPVPCGRRAFVSSDAVLTAIASWRRWTTFAVLQG